MRKIEVRWCETVAPLIGAWIAFGLFIIVAGGLVAWFADRLAHRRRNLALADLLTEIGKAYGRTTGEVAIAWTLRRPEVTAAIVGARTPNRY